MINQIYTLIIILSLLGLSVLYLRHLKRQPVQSNEIVASMVDDESKDNISETTIAGSKVKVKGYKMNLGRMFFSGIDIDSGE